MHKKTFSESTTKMVDSVNYLKQKKGMDMEHVREIDHDRNE